MSANTGKDSLLADYFVAKALAVARFTPHPTATEDHDCTTCVRRQMSHVDCCNEGWDRGNAGHPPLAPCGNYTTRGDGS